MSGNKKHYQHHVERRQCATCLKSVDDKKTRCPECRKKACERTKKWVDARKANGLCLGCDNHADPGRVHCSSCREKKRQTAKIYVEKNRPLMNAVRTRNKRRLKKELLAAYGAKCACCGESEPKFLSVDHIFNDGAEERRRLKLTPGVCGFYRYLKKLGWPKDRYQLLCFNCNHAKSLYGCCPHVDQRKTEELPYTRRHKPSKFICA